MRGDTIHPYFTIWAKKGIFLSSLHWCRCKRASLRGHKIKREGEGSLATVAVDNTVLLRVTYTYSYSYKWVHVAQKKKPFFPSPHNVHECYEYKVTYQFSREKRGKNIKKLSCYCYINEYEKMPLRTIWYWFDLDVWCHVLIRTLVYTWGGSTLTLPVRVHLCHNRTYTGRL